MSNPKNALSRPVVIYRVAPRPKPALLESEHPEATLRRKHNADRVAWDEERAELEAERNRLERELDGVRKELRSAENRADRLQAQLPGVDPGHLQLPGLKRARKAADVAVALAQDEADQLREALKASRYRRALALQVLAVLVATEDNHRLSDAQYEKRMDILLRRARTLVSMDRLAKVTERALLAPAVADAPKEE